MNPKVKGLLSNLMDRFIFFDKFCQIIVNRAQRRRIIDYYSKYKNIHPTVKLGDVTMDGDADNIIIGKGTYINSGQIFTGKKAKIRIGKYCAIGYNVHIKARTHDPYNATPTEERPYNIRIERDITIGDYVWIGDNVFINAGVKIGDNSIVGANAVVVHDIPPNTIVGGVPARILKTKYGENKENE